MFEGRGANGFEPFRERDAGQALAVLKGPSPNGNEVVWESGIGEILTLKEEVFFDHGEFIGKRNSEEVFTMSEGIASDGLDVVWEVDGDEVLAILERGFSNLGDALGESDVGELGGPFEGFLSDRENSIGKSVRSFRFARWIEHKGLQRFREQDTG